MNDALSTSMFWVGALFAFTPLVVGGIVLGVWWWTRRRARGTMAPSGQVRRDDAPGSGAPAVQR